MSRENNPIGCHRDQGEVINPIDHSFHNNMFQRNQQNRRKFKKLQKITKRSLLKVNRKTVQNRRPQRKDTHKNPKQRKKKPNKRDIPKK